MFKNISIYLIDFQANNILYDLEISYSKLEKKHRYLQNFASFKI